MALLLNFEMIEEIDLRAGGCGAPKYSPALALKKISADEHLLYNARYEQQRFTIEHQPVFNLFHSYYDPALTILKVSDEVLECRWEPGNSTKYDLLFTVLHRRDHRNIMMTWLKRGVGGTSVSLIGNDPNYLMEKMGEKNDHDFLAMMDLAYLLGFLDIHERKYKPLQKEKQ